MKDPGERTSGSIYRIGLPALPARGNEAVPERGPLFQGQVRHREAQLSARPAWAEALEAARVRHPAAREAEGQANLRAVGRAVPSDLRPGRTPQGDHRREPPGGA